MANSQTPSSKRPRTSSQNFNPFENLPYDMFENILSFLPIKEATQKCCTIGSSRFRNSMNLNRQFMFGREFALQYHKDYIAELVNYLFDTHTGKDIQTFQLHIDPIGIEILLNKWLHICIHKGVEYLELYLLQPGYTLSADIINGLKKLRTLKVVLCEFELPWKLESMVNLKNLVLWHVSLTEDKLETLVNHCRVLGTIDLLRCSGIRYVRIAAMEHKYLKVLRIAGLKELETVAVDSPTLESLHYSGHVIRITLYQQTPQLNDAFINFEAAGNRRYLQASDVEKLVTAIPNVTVLTASALVPEALTTRFRDGVYGEANYSFMNLKELQLIMEGALFCNPYDIVMLMKRCPMLEALFIDMNDYNFECGPYWELHQKSKLEKFDQNFDKLKFIKLKGFKFLKSELQLAKILLKTATHLEALVLVTPKNGRTKLYKTDTAIYNHFLLSWRASPEAKILLFEHMSDSSGVSPQHAKDWYY